MTAPRPRPECATRNRVIALFSDAVRLDCLGHGYLGNWTEREGNRCVEAGMLRVNLVSRGCSDAQITPAMREQVPANWKGDQAKESAVKNVLYRILEPDRDATQRLFELVKNQPGYH